MIEYVARDGTLVIATCEYADAADAAGMLEHCAVSSRASLRAQLDALAAREAKWIAAATPRQKAIGWGDHWVRRWQGISIYGRILGLDEYKRRERAASDSAHEFWQSLRHTLAAYERGWRYSEAYSRVCPEGDMPDDVHVAVMTPISRAAFAAARAEGWPPWPGRWEVPGG